MIYIKLILLNPAENYIIKQPEQYREILIYLQVIVERTLPELDLKYKYKIPFYYLNGKPFCYLNASHKKQFVDIGFCKGSLIKIHNESQISENRKKMTSLRYSCLKDINNQVLIEMLLFAKQLYI
jgi:hypothetical protein